MLLTNTLLAPVVNQKYLRPVVTRFIGPMHRYSLKVGAKASPKHRPIRLAARHVYTGFEARHALCGGQGFAPVQQPVEELSTSWSGPHGAELDVAFVVPRFRIGTAVTDCESDQFPITPEKHSVTQSLCAGGADFVRQIKTSI